MSPRAGRDLRNWQHRGIESTNTFGQPIPVYNDSGERIGTRASEVNRRTREPLSSAYLRDSGRRLIVSLRDGDVIALKPERLSKGETVTIKAHDLYGYLVRCGVQRRTLEKARAIKERKAQRLADQRRRRAEKRILRP